MSKCSVCDADLPGSSTICVHCFQKYTKGVDMVGYTEAEFIKQVLRLASLRGWRTAHFRPGMTKSGKWVTAVQGDGKGFPDLLLIRRGKVVVAELKVGKNKTTTEQDVWLEHFRQAEIPAFVWTPHDWDLIERTLE